MSRPARSGAGHPGGAPTPLKHAPGVAVAAIGTLAFGAGPGPEAPLIALGSVVGVALAMGLRADARGTAALSAAGSFSAVSALFGGPPIAPARGWRRSA